MAKGKKKTESDRMVLNQTELKDALKERKKTADKCKCPECGAEFDPNADSANEEDNP